MDSSSSAESDFMLLCNSCTTWRLLTWGAEHSQYGTALKVSLRPDCLRCSLASCMSQSLQLRQQLS